MCRLVRLFRSANEAVIVRSAQSKALKRRRSSCHCASRRRWLDVPFARPAVPWSEILTGSLQTRITREPNRYIPYSLGNDLEALCMSEYVESRYAKLVLQEARLAEEDVASRLVNQLLRDLGSPQGLNSARTQALTSIRSLARSLDQPRSRHAREWDAADQAAEAWCQNAYH
jgi:hypothetical protein